MKEKEAAELKFLKAQLQPHFLFNTLNNLYYLCLNRSEMAPEVVLKLSSLLDYVLHCGSYEMEDLSTEWAKLQDYCYLESLRYKDRLDLRVEKDGEMINQKIPSLLLITLAENCFKHGAMTQLNEIDIHIKLWVNGHQIKVLFKNKMKDEKTSGNSRISSGIGLANTKKQLDHYYGSNYLMEVRVVDRYYHVELNLPKT
jgi:LytS/YehU family sensor histidine kinase